MRSPYPLPPPPPHACLKAIDPTAALAVPGVLAVYTIADLDTEGIGSLPCDESLTNRDGRRMVASERPVLTRGIVRYVGDPVAFVVADTQEAARDGAETVRVRMPAL